MRTIITVLLLYVMTNTYAQEKKSVLERLPVEEMTDYENKLLKKLRRNRCIDRKKDYSMLHIYKLHLDTVIKYNKPINTNELLNNLNYDYGYKNKEKFPTNNTIVYYDTLNIVAETDGIGLYCSKYNSSVEKTDMMLTYAVRNKVDFLFSIYDGYLKYHFAVKDNEIYILEGSDEFEYFTAFPYKGNENKLHFIMHTHEYKLNKETGEFYHVGEQR